MDGVEKESGRMIGRGGGSAMSGVGRRGCASKGNEDDFGFVDCEKKREGDGRVLLFGLC